jgi:hypothetical protein
LNPKNVIDQMGNPEQGKKGICGNFGQLTSGQGNKIYISFFTFDAYENLPDCPYGKNGYKQ